MYALTSHNNSPTETWTYSSSEYQFAICKICFWSATVFKSGIQDNKNKKSDNNMIHTCPLCSSNNISLISIANDIDKKQKIEKISGLNFDTERMQIMIDSKLQIVSNQVQYSITDRR